ncbi:MAG: hypothetical protein ACP5KY_02545 [Thermoproteus sp.]
MRFSIIITMMGVAMVAIAAVLFFLGSSASSLAASVNAALAQLNKTSALTLSPGGNVSFSFSEPSILLINSSAPLKIVPESLRVAVQGTITAVAVQPGVRVYVVNNYTRPVSLRYAVVTISPSLSRAVFFALVSLGLGFVGFVVLVIGVVLYVLKR